MEMYELRWKISLKFVPKVQVNNILAFVRIMAWRRIGGKPLSEAMMIILLAHLCVTRPQWVNQAIIFSNYQIITTRGPKHSDHQTDYHPNADTYLILVIILVCITDAGMGVNIYTKSNIVYGMQTPSFCLCRRDFMTWKHFPHFWPFVRGILKITEFYQSRHWAVWTFTTHTHQWHRAGYDFSPFHMSMRWIIDSWNYGNTFWNFEQNKSKTPIKSINVLDHFVNLCNLSVHCFMPQVIELSTFISVCGLWPWHIEVETKWSSFCRPHFQKHFRVRKLLHLHSYFTEICSESVSPGTPFTNMH